MCETVYCARIGIRVVVDRRFARAALADIGPLTVAEGPMITQNLAHEGGFLM